MRKVVVEKQKWTYMGALRYFKGEVVNGCYGVLEMERLNKQSVNNNLQSTNFECLAESQFRKL